MTEIMDWALWSILKQEAIAKDCSTDCNKHCATDNLVGFNACEENYNIADEVIEDSYSQ